MGIDALKHLSSVGVALHTEKLGGGRPGAGVAAAWAFAEATVFFIVPDVWLTRMALRDWRGALRACLLATLAAAAGGALMFAWGRADVEAAERMLAAIPAISPAMIADVRHELAEDGSRALLGGPLSGVPYKIYAVEAGARGVDFAGFLGWSVAGRLPRFVALTLAAALAARLLARRAGWLVPLHAGLWVAFYAAYFWRFG